MIQNIKLFIASILVLFVYKIDAKGLPIKA